MSGTAVAHACEDQARRGGYSILVVDDLEPNIFVISIFLTRLGYRCGRAGNGQEAVNAVRAGEYDLVLMDCQMPVMDGIEATRVIRAMAAPHGSIPIIAMTANATPETAGKCFAAGMNDLFAKPLDYGRLDEVILKWIGARGEVELEVELGI